MPDNTGIEKEKHMKQLKRKIECWREVILLLNSILLWERPWYPGLILWFTTLISILTWIYEPALLTMLSLSLLTLALVDYFVPIVTSFLCPAGSWTGQKEKKLNEICQNMSNGLLRLQTLWMSMVHARNTWPNIFYGAITVFLILFAWIGNTINNLLLLYVAVNAILLMPGLRHQGLIETGAEIVYEYLTHRRMS